MKKLLLLGVLALLPLSVHADPAIENAAERVENQIERDGYLRPFNFETDTIGRTIRIRGRVNTYAQKRRVGVLGRRFSRGFRIDNRVRVARR